jgi:hypothetical protein
METVLWNGECSDKKLPISSLSILMIGEATPSNHRLFDTKRKPRSAPETQLHESKSASAFAEDKLFLVLNRKNS